MPRPLMPAFTAPASASSPNTSPLNESSDAAAAENNKCWIDILPNELLAEIFFLFVFSVEKSRRAKVAMRLAHVGREWRSFAMGLATFWSQITVSTIFDADILHLLFQLHSHRPLDITIDYPKDIPINATLRFWKIILSVANQMSKCRQLRIKTTGSNFQLIYKAFLSPCDAPRLEYLELIRTDRDQSISACFPAVKFVPEVLLQVHVNGVFWETALHAPVGVQQLHLKDTDAAWLGVPPCGVSLQSLTISYTPIGWSTGLKLDTSALVSLKVEGDSSLTLFSHNIAFNTLQYLEVAALSDHAWAGLVGSFRRSMGMFGAVKHLKLSYMSPEWQWVDARFLEAFPVLEVLEFFVPGYVPSSDFLGHYRALMDALRRIMVNGIDISHLLALPTGSSSTYH
ncbi:hypothetical protein AX17_001531 [Amanita inopinata Kibby_2008]|nr:hypothetical protein AX17_001531 [Amanita inopinata Kibby_2008]